MIVIRMIPIIITIDSNNDHDNNDDNRNNSSSRRLAGAGHYYLISPIIILSLLSQFRAAQTARLGYARTAIRGRGVIRLETLIELNYLNSRCSSLSSYSNLTNSSLSSNSRQQYLSQQYPPPILYTAGGNDSTQNVACPAAPSFQNRSTDGQWTDSVNQYFQRLDIDISLLQWPPLATTSCDFNIVCVESYVECVPYTDASTYNIYYTCWHCMALEFVVQYNML